MSTVIEFVKKLDGKIDSTAERIKDRKVKFYPTLIGPILFIVFSVVVLALMPSQIKIQPGRTINARTFPTILIYLVAGSSVLMLLREGLKVVRKIPLEVSELELLTEIKALILLALLILYAFLMKTIGFIASSVIYSVLMLYYFRVKKWNYYAIVVVSAIAIGMIFRYALHVRLP
jgi:putative tricarboxylic transport membrane protein